MCPYISQQLKLRTVNIKQWILYDSVEMWGLLREEVIFIEVSVGRVKFIKFLHNKKLNKYLF
jgi:hypothetical protein